MPEIVSYTKNGADLIFETKANASNLYLKKTDATETVQDIVGTMLASGGYITLAYDDATGRVTITGTGGDAEVIRDAIGAALIGTNGVTVAPNDAADTIVLSLDSTVVKTTDPRLTNSRTPTSHASTHASGGTDALTPADIGALGKTEMAANSKLLNGVAESAFSRTSHTHSVGVSATINPLNGWTISNVVARRYGQLNFLRFSLTTPNRTVPAGESHIGSTTFCDSTGDVHGGWNMIGNYFDHGVIVINGGGNIFVKHENIGLPSMPCSASFCWINP